MQIGIYYGSSYGNTEHAAQTIAEQLKARGNLHIEVMDVSRKEFSRLNTFDVLLFGCSTWHIGDLQDDWDTALSELQKQDLSGKKVGLFGAGDQYTYADTFQDALGILAEAVEHIGGELIGFTSTEGYEHVASKAQRGDQFVGLALDYDNQEDLNEIRIGAWTEQILQALTVTA